MGFIVTGIIITSNTNKKLTIYNPGFMTISDTGTIEAISKKDLRLSHPHYAFIDFSNQLITPGFIDLHNHLPQHAFMGLGDGQLLAWLEKYTFPREEKFENEIVANRASANFFSALIAAGTTTTVTFPTIHEQATDIAFAAAERSGIRAIIGKVMMDQNTTPKLSENLDKSLKSSEKLIEKWHKKNNKLFYAITPRFAISCTDRMLKQAGILHQKYDTYVQTHLSENLDEIAAIKKLFPENKNYLDVYNSAGLIGSKTLLAHAIYLNKEEYNTIKKLGAHIVHCPTSNRFIKSGIMPCRKYLNLNMSVGLGTDIAGGYSVSMLHEMRECIENSKILSLYDKDQPEPITLEEAFFMATLGGAFCLGIESTTGSLTPGKTADFVVLNPKKADPFIWDNTYHEPHQLLAKCVYATEASPISAVFIGGKKISPEPICN